MVVLPGMTGCFENSTVVHEHATSASVISKGSVPEFFISYSFFICSPRITDPKFFLASVTVSLACDEALSEKQNKIMTQTHLK
jgi:hypothetical protein